ncbi:CD209 antigen-like protein C [Paramisgurnus dabryanus]|uniref:CD209 antigen-like protein C n=1 Tax=Paramisgurnus dabryanus TaxID=90735 RepID=UPI0031F3C7FD
MYNNKDTMHDKLTDEPDSDLAVYRNTADVPYSDLNNPRNNGKRPFCQDPFKVATACLTAFCLLLLVVLVATNVHRSSSVQDLSSSSAKSQTCANVTALTAELQTLRKEKSDLEKERSQLKIKITELGKASCTVDWHYFEGSCYFISDYSRSWPSSQTYCKQKGGDLAIILTADEQTFVWNLLPRGHWNAYWIGLTDEKVEEHWHWVDGTKLVGGFWEHGEPNNDINEDCANMVKTTVLSRVAIRSWYDAPCEMSRPFICEKKADSSS